MKGGRLVVPQIILCKESKEKPSPRAGRKLRAPRHNCFEGRDEEDERRRTTTPSSLRGIPTLPSVGSKCADNSRSSVCKTRDTNKATKRTGGQGRWHHVRSRQDKIGSSAGRKLFTNERHGHTPPTAAVNQFSAITGHDVLRIKSARSDRREATANSNEERCDAPARSIRDAKKMSTDEKETGCTDSRKFNGRGTSTEGRDAAVSVEGGVRDQA